MKLDFEYGNGMMSAELPDSTDVFVTGETVPDPPCLPQDWDALYQATLESIRRPIGMPPLAELARRAHCNYLVVKGADEVMDQKYGMYGYSLMGTIDQYHLYRRVKQ